MKTFLLTTGLLVVIIVVVIIQSVQMHSFKDEFLDLLPTLTQAYEQNHSEKFHETSEKLQQTWENHHTWFSLTVDSRTIEDIELSLKRTVKYGQMRDTFDFYAEKINLEGMITRLPKREGAYLKELL